MPQPSTVWSVNRMPGVGGRENINVNAMESPNTATVTGPCLPAVTGAAANDRGIGLAGTGRGALSPLANGGATPTCGPPAGGAANPKAKNPAAPPAAAPGRRPRPA